MKKKKKEKIAILSFTVVWAGISVATIALNIVAITQTSFDLIPTGTSVTYQMIGSVIAWISFSRSKYKTGSSL